MAEEGEEEWRLGIEEEKVRMVTIRFLKAVRCAIGSCLRAITVLRRSDDHTCGFGSAYSFALECVLIVNVFSEG